MKTILSFCVLLIGFSSALQSQTYSGKNQLLIIWHTTEGKEVVMHKEKAAMEINFETGQFFISEAFRDFVWLDSLQMPDSIDAHELLENLFRQGKMDYISFNVYLTDSLINRQSDSPHTLSFKGNFKCGQLADDDIEIPLEVWYSDQFLFFNLSYSFSLNAFVFEWKNQYGNLIQDKVEIRVVSGKLSYD